MHVSPSAMQLQSKTNRNRWRFNRFFEEHDSEEAIRLAYRYERERIEDSQMPLLQEIYSESWDSWKSMPGASLVEELMRWDEETKKDYENEPWFPSPTQSRLIRNGELSLDQLRTLYLRLHIQTYSFYSPVSKVVWNAYLEGKDDVKELASWWRFDEVCHEEMLRDFCINTLRIQPNLINKEIRKFFEELEKLPKVSREQLPSANAFQAFRDGPAMLVGVAQLSERNNVSTMRATIPALRKNYGFSIDEMPFFNVHTYIDLYHVRFGQYILAKYAVTKEEADLVRKVFQSRRLAYYERTREFFERFQVEKIPGLSSEDSWFQV